MTTPRAAKLYEAQHVASMAGRETAVFNPHNKPLDELPRIYGFNNGSHGYFLSAVALSADGVVLGGHGCSSEAYIPHDLGILEGTRPDRHEKSYQVHYPDGYVMEFVPGDKIANHTGLRKAIHLAEKRISKDS